MQSLFGAGPSWVQRFHCVQVSSDQMTVAATAQEPAGARTWVDRFSGSANPFFNVFTQTGIPFRCVSTLSAYPSCEFYNVPFFQWSAENWD
eukprot:310147-Chlamydomonas_euryale.AAC.1